MTEHFGPSLAAVAAFGLPGSLTEFPSEPMTPNAWSDLLAAVRRQKLLGLLASAAAHDALPVTDAQREELEGLHLDAMVSALLLERTMLEVVALLAKRCIDVRVLKGSAVAHLDYADAALRSFGDIDLLVRPEQFDAAVEALVGAGHERRFPEPRPGFDKRFSKGTSFNTSDGIEIDLHRTFVMGPFGIKIDLDELWERSEEFELGGVTLKALALEERLLHACYHAALGDVPPRLAPRRDVAEMVLFGNPNVQRVFTLASHWRAQSVVAHALRSTWTELRLADVVALSAWAEAYRIDESDSRDLAVYLNPRNSYAAKSLAVVRALPSWRERLAFVRALALPSHGYVDGRHAGPLRRLRHGLSAIHGGRGAA